jgi:hypothetical protein
MLNDLLSALSSTPLPTILVVAGILFWILAIAGSLAGKITVEKGKQKTAGLVGTALIALGLVLFFVPSNQPEPGRTKEAQTPGSSTPGAQGFPAPKQTPTNAPQGSSLWIVDKSRVYLRAEGDRRQFFLDGPSAELASQGARSGELLFDGQKVNATYKGKLYVFAGRCGTREYDASGPINSDDQVTLTGTAPQIDPDSCLKTGEQQKTLVFNFTGLAH